MKDSDILAALSDSPQTAAGLTGRINPGATAEITWEVVEGLSQLEAEGLVRSYEAGGVTWYEAEEAPLLPKKTPKLDAGYADEDPGDGGREDRRYGN